MNPVSHNRPAGLRRAVVAVTLVLAASLLSSCVRETPEHQGRPDDAGDSSLTARDQAGGRSSAPGGIVRRLPSVPADRAPALARQLELAAATLRDLDAAAGDVRRAGEFEQLAVRTLANAADTFRSEVMRRLRPRTAALVRSCVDASRLLHAMTSPQRKFPHWHVVAPPPARELLRYYRLAQRRTRVPWTYLAAIHLVETRMGRIRGASTAGALGPMQFLPSTWDLYGAGGDINDPRDAILAAARLLKANGAPGDMPGALRHYNQSGRYVRAVGEYARTMARSRTAYRGYWHWRVLFRHVNGTYVLPVGYPAVRPVLVSAR